MARYNNGTSAFEQARRLDGMRVEDACAVMGVSSPTWYEFLEKPWLQPLGKVVALYKAMSPEARELLVHELDAMFGRTA